MSDQRWKQAERRIATALQKAAGKVTDPRIAPLVTSTGRVGHLVALGFDLLVGEGETALVGEAKRRRTFLSADALRALLQIIRIGFEWGRWPVLGFSLTESVPAFIDTRNGKKRIPRDFLVLPLSFAEKTIAALRYVEENDLTSDFIVWQDHQNTEPFEEVLEEVA